MKDIKIHYFSIYVFFIGLLAFTTGCGGPGEPPAMTPEVQEEIRQQDAAVADQESAM
jgi:hypothetical protein